MPINADEMRRLLESGMQAPSADNRHVVRFEPHGNGLRLHVAAGAIDEAPRHRIVFHQLAFGAIIENIALAATTMGRTAVTRVNPDWPRDDLIADIELTGERSARPPDPLAEAIFTRVTNRRLYERRRANGTVLDEVSRAVSPVAGAQVRWLDERVTRSRALALLFRSERERFRRERLHAELFDAIRFDLGWLTDADEGLPPGALEIEAPLRPVFRKLRRWPIQRSVNLLGAASVLAVRAAWLPAWTAPHLALLVVEPAGNGGFIDAGRALQRFWLAAARNSLAVQPMGASIALANQDFDGAWAPEAICARTASELGDLAEGARPAMLFRVGYARAPTVRAGRRDIGSYLVTRAG